MSVTKRKSAPSSEGREIWWSNAIFFVFIHLAALTGLYFRPPWSPLVPWRTLLAAFLHWQLADFGITVGYHRLYSHRAFRARFAVRVALAALGSAAFQGSIKWWALRHRLHHRFTDDQEHDPYAATNGLLFSHLGWIFFKPKYERMALVDRDDLDSDPVVRFQHRHYVPLALSLGIVVPSALGLLWGDIRGSFVYSGLVSRLFIWHCTFLVNSLAHWDGLQPYSDEDTSRGNLILALLTGGEGNHNFHAFPHDFRSGPSLFDWDPSKWIILALNSTSLATGLRRANANDISFSLKSMDHKTHHGVYPPLTDGEWEGPVFSTAQVEQYVAANGTRCLIIIEEFLVDCTSYMAEHPGGARILRRYSLRAGEKTTLDASWAFSGGLNNHSRAASRSMLELRVARIVVD